LDPRLARLEEHAETTATQNLDLRLGQLEERADANATQIVGAHKQSLEENERLGARLAGLEQSLAVLSNQLSLIKEVIDGATAREQDIKNSIEAVNSRVVDIQHRVDELFPRLALGEKAHKDLGTLISLFLKRLKRMNVNSTETALRLGTLEKHVRAKAEHLEEPRGSILEQPNEPSTTKTENLLEDARSKPADGPAPTEVNGEREKADGFERPSTSAEESSNEVSVEAKGPSDTSRADQHAT
jgi:chromosome segregation ATPase